MVTVKKKEVKGYLLLRSGFAAKALAKITNEFHEDNKIGDFQFGEIYRGTSREEEVTVKIWRDEGKYEMRPGDNQSRFSDETQLLEHFIKTESHPSLAKLRGVSTDSKILAIIYHLKTVNSVHNLLEKDSFTWEQRIKVALGFASLLEFMHAENPPYMPCLIRNIHAAHILLNEDYKPVLIDYSMLSGGILTDRRHIVNQYLEGCHGYVDPVVAHRGEWSDKSDVFSYGVLLLALISKRIPEEESELTENKHKPQNSMMSFSEHKSSVVHQSLEFEPYFYSSDGVKVAKLAIKCMQYHPQKRPTMKQVVRYLQNLCIVRRHSNELNIHKILGDDEIVLRTDNRSEKESKLIPAWRWEYFSKSINLKRLSYRDKGGPNHGPAGKWKMFLCPKVQFSK